MKELGLRVLNLLQLANHGVRACLEPRVAGRGVHQGER